MKHSTLDLLHRPRSSNMLGSYVCKQCRTRLHQHITPIRTPQWQPRATILSFLKAKSQTQPQPQPQTGPAQPDAPTRQEHAEYEGHGTRHMRHENVTRGPRGRYSHLVDRVEGRVQEAPSNAPTSSNPGGSEQVLGPAATMKQMLDSTDGDGLAKAWAVFEENYTSKDCKAMTEPAESDFELLRDGLIFRDLMHKISGEFCNRRNKPFVPPSKALFRLEQLGLATPEMWARQTLGYLTNKAMFNINALSAHAMDLPSLLHELISLWRLFFQCKGPNAQLESIQSTWNLPSTDSMPPLYDSKDFSIRMQQYHPRYSGNPTLGFCAVYFYTLSDALGTVESLQTEAEPLLQFLRRLLASASIHSIFKHTENSAQFKLQLPKEIQNDIIHEINLAPSRALAELASQGMTSKDSATSSPEANLEEFQLRRIARSVKSRQSSTFLNFLWEDTQSVYSRNGKLEIPRRIYNAFLSGYLILHQAPSSVKVWNHMIAHGVNPDIESWVALLHGCARARDLEGFNAMWTRMLASGIEPDEYAWTTRVHGLFSLREINAGLAALDNMGRRWLEKEKAASQPKSKYASSKKLPAVINTRTKPNIQVINGAITALVQVKNLEHGKRVDYVQKILGWAGHFAIKPDAITYNALIQLYLRASNYPTVLKLLHQMEKEDIEGDVATHTMLISASFNNGSFDNLTKSQQTDKIIKLFDDLEASGIKLNDYVYSTAIDRLIKDFSNHSAINRIFEHMQARNMTLSAHAYTSLITFCFQQSPLPLQAIDALVHTFFTSHQVPTDQILFDRTIEGYASHGETGRMMFVLTRMRRLGALPGWGALAVVIDVLCRKGEVDRARGIVQDVESGMGLGSSGVVGGMLGEKRFFHIARKLGIWEPDGGDREKEGMNYDFVMSDRAVKPSVDDMVREAQRRGHDRAGMLGQEEEEQEQEQEDMHGFPREYHNDMHSRVNRY
ncbi:hypothetical protein ACEQ8H_007855 [Pleosporales sp. CAS-2024a]